MEWPPKFITYDEFKTELQDAIDKHPHFEKWLLSKYKINRSYSYQYICIDIHGKTDYSIEALKQLYYDEQQTKINTNMIEISMLELTLKNNTYTKEDEEQEEIYNIKKKEYDSIVEEQGKLFRAGCRNIKTPRNVEKPYNMTFRELLPKSIDAAIEKNEELIKTIYSNKPI